MKKFARASGCEVTLTFDAAAAAGKRLTACRGPPNAAPAFTGRAGAVTKLKRGFNVLAVDETTDEVMRFENEMDAFDEATANAIGASDRLPPFLLDAFTSLVPLASRVDVAVPNIADEDEEQHEARAQHERSESPWQSAIRNALNTLRVLDAQLLYVTENGTTWCTAGHRERRVAVLAGLDGELRAHG